MSRKRTSLLPRYEEIALDLAETVARGELKVGDRVAGRSGLAGRYKVSPETVRRAVALLHAQGVLKTVPGLGIRVESRHAAAQYLRDSERTLALLRLESEVKELLSARHELDERLGDAIAKMVRVTSGAVGTMRHVDEVTVNPQSAFVGTTLLEAGLREKTGATVIGIVREGEEMFSPDPHVAIRAQDLLIIVGSDEAKERLKALVGEGGS